MPPMRKSEPYAAIPLGLAWPLNGERPGRDQPGDR
jgi:hypothetical protein